MPTVLILELSYDGHHPRYVRWIVESCLELGAKVVLAGPTGLLNHRELSEIGPQVCRHLLTVSDSRLRILKDLSTPLSLARRQFLVRKIYKKAFLDVERGSVVDAVIVPYADDCLDAFAVSEPPFRKTPWFGIVMRPNFHFRSVGVRAPRSRLAPVRQLLFRRLLRQGTLKYLCTIDPTLSGFVRSQFHNQEDMKLVFLPDPVPEHDLVSPGEARLRLGVPCDANLVVVYGALDERKGVAQLLEAAASLDCPVEIHLLLAGRRSHYVDQLLSNPSASRLQSQGRLHQINGYLTDDQEALILAAADCLWAGYIGFYQMSSILVLAARHGVPSIVSDSGICGYLASKHRLGWLIDPTQPKSILSALESVAESCMCSQDRTCKTDNVFSRHTIENFRTVITHTLQSTLAYSADQ